VSRPYGYASLADVKRHLSFVPTFTATSKPNADEVNAHLLGVADELDAALLRQDYSVPVPTVATASLELLRQWTSIGAAMYTVAATPQGKDSKHLELLERRFSTILKGIADGSNVLPDHEKDTSTSLPRFAARSPDAEGASPYFTRAGEGGR